MAMAGTLFPEEADRDMYSKLAHQSLDEMISKGNRVAEERKGELVLLESLCRELSLQSEQQGLQILTLAPNSLSEPGILQGNSSELGVGEDTRNATAVADVEGASLAALETDEQILAEFFPMTNALEFLDDMGIM